ncbi:protein C19orf12 homolog [Planococcus citri]|uniref:protein C19orf12 homolog n=1 Tax=Planococcus citri TaxID=170843 RepID=UPI0031F82F10
MVIRTREIVEIMADLARHENIRVNITESLKGGLVTGASAFLGGVFLGPLGIAAGAALGGLTAASTCSNFRPIAEILLNDLTSAQQALLVNRVNNVIQNLGVEDVVTLTAMIASRGGLRDNLVDVLRLFVTSDLHYSLAR